MTEIMTIHVVVDRIDETDGENEKAVMAAFHGECHTELFSVDILPGGVDTQRIFPDGRVILSARYMLEGHDSENSKCRMFIENNGTCDYKGNVVTRPRIITDSISLQWLETAELSGTVSKAGENEVEIHIFSEKNKKEA